MPFVNQALNPATMAGKVAEPQCPIVVRIKVNNADIAFSVDVCHPHDVGISQRMVTADNEGDDVAAVAPFDARDFPDHMTNRLNGALGAQWIHWCIAVVHDSHLSKRIHQGAHMRHRGQPPRKVVTR